MLPSTFTSESQKVNTHIHCNVFYFLLTMYQEASRIRKLQAKLKVIELLQAASSNLVLREKLDSEDVRESLVAFMLKVN